MDSEGTGVSAGWTGFGVTVGRAAGEAVANRIRIEALVEVLEGAGVIEKGAFKETAERLRKECWDAYVGDIMGPPSGSPEQGHDEPPKE